MGLLRFTQAEIETYYRVRVPRVKQLGNEWRGPCPVHDGKNDSFAVSPISGQAYCHSKCDHGWDLVGLEMVLTSEDRTKALREVLKIVGREDATKRIVAEYGYTDESGKLLFQAVRYSPKQFRFRRPDGRGGWIWNLNGVPKVLYHLPEVLKATTVFLVEGEKDADTARVWGLTATTNPGGAKKWLPIYTESLIGKEVMLIPDRDPKGRDHADLVKANLVKAGIRARIVTLPIGKDLTEWKERHNGTIEQLRLLIESSPKDDLVTEDVPVIATRAQPLYTPGCPYCFYGGAIWGFRYAKEEIWTPFKITNFEARIVKEQVLDDGGGEEILRFTVNAAVGGRTSTIEINAKDFRSMNWVTERLGGMAIVYSRRTEDARTAIQYLSADIPTIRVFSHTGWRKIDGQPHFLHADGAIGDSGNRTDVQVDLNGILPNYSLPDPPIGDELTQVIRSSLAILDVTPDRITFPVLGAAYRAPLGPCHFSIFLEGISGQGKTQLAALAQQHFGKRMDAQNLPASWDDTGLASGLLAYHAKDAVLVVDDFVLTGNAARQQKLQAEADRLLRSQANASGRRRLTTEGRLRSSHPPRGLIISTGEHTPQGKSLNARMVIVPFPKGAMNWSQLTECQAAAARGDFAAAMAAYIQWIARDYSTLQDQMAHARIERRRSPVCNAPHMRTPENLAELEFGFQTFLRFARESNAICEEESYRYAQRAKAALHEVAANEQGKHSLNDPPRIFLRMVRTAFLMGRAHLRSPSGGVPDDKAPWGWDRTRDPAPQGAKIGWLKKYEVCLDPDASFQIAQKLAQERGESLPGSVDSIKRHLKEEGYVKSDTKRRTTTMRRTFEGEPRDVLCFDLETFQNASLEPADNADNADDSLPDEGEE